MDRRISDFVPRHSLIIRQLDLSLLLSRSGVGTVFAQKRNITEKDLWDFVWIGDPQVSPDGSRVAFVRVTVNEKKEGYNTSIWSVPVAGGEAPRQLTKGDHDTHAALVAGRKISAVPALDRKRWQA